MSWGPISIEETRAFVAQQMLLARTEPRDEYGLAVEIRATGEMAGRLRLTVKSVRDRRGDVGYVLRRSFWGMGYATEAVQRLVAFGFDVLDLHRIEATCSPENVASIHVLEKVGLELEGRLRQNVWVRGGWRDSLLYAVLRPASR
jgi:RimJ/RimL family protein N-acetyltransferase